MLAQLACTLTKWHCNSCTENGAVGLERSKQRLLVTIGKVVAQSKSVRHMIRKMDQKLASVLVPEKMSQATATQSIWKNSGVQNTNLED